MCVSEGKQFYFVIDLLTFAKAKTLRIVWRFETVEETLGKKLLKVEGRLVLGRIFVQGILLLTTYNHFHVTACKCKN